MLETAFRRKAMRDLKALPNTKWLRIEQRSLRATLDCIGCIDGHLVVVEFKASSKKATAHQAHEIKKWESVGAVCFVVTPESWDEAYAKIKSLVEFGVY